MIPPSKYLVVNSTLSINYNNPHFIYTFTAIMYRVNDVTVHACLLVADYIRILVL